MTGGGQTERILLQPAFVLHQRPYRESSRLLDVFTRDQGRQALVARGLSGRRSQRRALLQPFRPLRLSYSRRTDLGTLTGVEPGENSALLGLSGDALWAGFYLNELLLRLLPRQDPHPALFSVYQDMLQRLPGAVLEPLVRCFEKRLLAELGYGLQLEEDIAGHPIDPAGHYDYRPEEGPVPVSGDTADAVPGRSLLALAREQWPDRASLRDARRILHRALTPHLGGRPLQTLALLARMYR